MLLGCCCLLALTSYAQKKNINYRYQIHRSASKIKIDGLLDEAGWQAADTTTDFAMVLPMDTSRTNVRTTVRMTYDDDNLYISAVCYQPTSGYMVESLKRDFNFGKNDNFIFFLDPFDARTDGFSFGANAAGAQWDGTMYEGSKVDLSWDNKWYSVVKNYPDRYVFEAAIPFKTIRYKKGIREWGVNFSRNDLKTTEKSAWAPVPRQFPTASLAYTGTIVWDEAPPVANSNISVIPYALAGVTKDYTNHTGTDWRKDVGGDVKIGLTSSLNLDLTVNPDFSQVDVDQQVINLNRYELFFPEKRQFFLENGDLFANFGYADIRPFFSRRIGLNAPIRAGGRMTGKINKNWRVGVMDVQTGQSGAGNLPAQNFGIVTLQRRVFSRSNIGIMFVNKDGTGSAPNPGNTSPAYNRNLGVEYNLASSNNLWTGKLLGLKSFTPGVKGHDYVQAAHLQYLSKYWTLYLQQQYVGRNYNAEVGYVPRNGYNKLNPLLLHNFFPKSGAVLSHGVQLSSNYFFDEHYKRTDNESILSYIVTFRNRSVLTFSGLDTYVKLLRPFDPTNTGKPMLPVGFENHWNTGDVQYASKPQSLFTYLGEVSYGGYYDDGTRLALIGQIGYRFQPFVNLSLNLAFNDLHLPQPYGRNKFWLIGPRADVTFTNTLYFTTYVQYNEQANNMNINTRLQWRYKPASDFFIVYGDNSIPSPFMAKNRQLVIKWTYWWNI
ncbi:hydrolase [Mucilaginibacter terrenus]|uniref:Hydrolase n=1 Tax=Mucilaginibacter terrenus TaxID=2482727 RepID=A0A3E2NXU4_9SPHI|nr:hydrolase [Mucilaginibacter terrenus]